MLLGIAEYGLDELAGGLAQPVARMARRALVDAARAIGDVLGHVRRDIELPTAGDEIRAVTGLVGTDGFARLTRQITEHGQHPGSALPFASVTRASTKPLRFSVRRDPEAGTAAVFEDLVASLESGSALL